MFAFDSRTSNGSTFEKVSVQFDKQTGEFIGIDKFLDLTEIQQQNSHGGGAKHSAA